MKLISIIHYYALNLLNSNSNTAQYNIQETSYKEASDPEKMDGKLKEKKKKLKDEVQKHDKVRRNQNITITADHDEVHDFNKDDDHHHEIASVNFNQNNSELSQSHIQLAGMYSVLLSF